MRKLGDILQEFRARPLAYWFGASPRCSFELNDHRIFKRVGTEASEFARISQIVSWRALGRRTTAVRFEDHTDVIFDSTGNLRAILRQAAGDREEKELSPP